MYKYWGLGFCIVGIIGTIYIMIIQPDSESVIYRIQNIICALLIVIGITLLS